MKEEIDHDNLPRHIAVIMDGNGRWAKRKGAMRLFGHKNAITAVREVTEGCAELGIEYLTLYAFSTENWGRPRDEVNGLMNLLVHTIRNEINKLMENKVKLRMIGDPNQLPSVCQRELEEAVKATKDNPGLTLTLALNYSGRHEIADAVKSIAQDAKNGTIALEDISPELISSHLQTRDMPDPELLIRTSGEMRVSNFLLWQIAYTELYITDLLWPDFRRKHLYEALATFQKRERRFGKISEQLKI